MKGIIDFFLILILRRRVQDYIGIWSLENGKIARRLIPFGYRHTWIWDRCEGTTALDRFIARQHRRGWR